MCTPEEIMRLGVLILAIGYLSIDGWSQQYTVQKLGTFGGSASFAYSVNDSGQVAGEANLAGDLAAHAFVYQNGAMVDLGTLGGSASRAFSLNNTGQLTGQAELPNLRFHAFLYSSGNMQDLDPAHPNRVSSGSSINASAAILGYRAFQPVVFSGGTVTAVPHGAFSSISAVAINDSGQIAGTCLAGGGSTEHACRVSGTTVKDLPPLSSFAKSLGNAINNAGDVCGLSMQTGSNPLLRATVWSGGSKFNLGSLSGYRQSQCNALNNFGQRVGNATQNNDPFTRHAVLFNSVIGVKDLNQLIPQNSGVVITDAVSISNTGYIAASCDVGQACLLTPNTILILKKYIFALEQGDPGCIACSTTLVPEAQSLPNSLNNLTPAQQKQVFAIVTLMKSQLQVLGRAGQISASQERLLVHQAQLVLDQVG